ncbi:hypothetical protein BDDG_13750, partial [Blastomyces dermatitidis ATCC 18188]
AVSKSAVSKPAQNPEKTEKNTAHASIHRKVKKKMQKEKNFQIFRNRRLILKVSNQDTLQRNKLNSNLIFRIRNEINQQFFSQLMTDIEVQKPVIASIEPSFFENSIILTTMPEFNMNTLQSHVLETQNVHSVPEITKLVSINVKYAQKEVKFVNILCLSALTAKKNMHLAQKN